jgi:Ca2+-binding EF-hand superfamily protein
MIHSLKDDDLRPKIFAFEFYDERADGKITADEIYKLEQILLAGTPIYDECYV